MIFGSVRYFVGIARIARQHWNSVQELRTFCFDNEKPFGFARTAFLTGRGANETFAHERTAGCDRIRPLVGALETNSGMQDQRR